MGERTNQDLRGAIAAQAQARAADLQQTRGAGLENPNPAASPNSQLGHASHPTRLTGDLGDVRPVAGPQHVQGQEVVTHDPGSR